MTQNYRPALKQMRGLVRRNQKYMTAQEISKLIYDDSYGADDGTRTIDITGLYVEYKYSSYVTRGRGQASYDSEPDLGELIERFELLKLELYNHEEDEWYEYPELTEQVRNLLN